MRIVIDGRMYGWTGIGRVTRKLLEELPALDQDNEYIVLLQPADFDKWQPPAANFQKVRADFLPYSLGEQVALPRLLRKLKPDLVHFLNFNLPLTYSRPYVVTIHDLTLIRYKNVRGAALKALAYQLKYWAMRLVVRHAAKAATQIITLTKTGQKEIAERFRLPASKIHPIYLGSDTLPAKPKSLERLGLFSDFLLYVGNTYPFKNVGRLVQILPELRQKHSDLKLVIVGNVNVGNTKYFYDQLKQQAKELGLEDSVIFPGYVDDGELAGLYQQASLFVFPSLAEGFGLPAIEAMAAGTPVAASSASCIPEVCGEAAAYFDPNSNQSMITTIDELLNDPAKREALKTAGLEHAKQFSWQKTAKATHQVYEQALKASHAS